MPQQWVSVSRHDRCNDPDKRADLQPFAWCLLDAGDGAQLRGGDGACEIHGAAHPPAESAFLRYLLGLVFLIPMIGSLRAVNWTRQLHGLFAMRGAVHALGVIMWFFAMTRIPLAEVTAMNYLSPVYVTLGAALFMGEKLAFRRIAAIAVALLGVVVILRPGFREVSPGHLAMLVTGFAFGLSYLLAKTMVGRTNPTVVVAMLSLWVTLGLAPFALMNWVTPTLAELGLLFLVACFATA